MHPTDGKAKGDGGNGNHLIEFEGGVTELNSENPWSQAGPVILWVAHFNALSWSTDGFTTLENRYFISGNWIVGYHVFDAQVAFPSGGDNKLS